MNDSSILYDMGTDPSGMGQFILIFWLALIAVNALVGWLIGRGKGRGCAGFWCGFCLGWLGWIIAACLRPSLEWESRRASMVAKAVRESKS